MAKIARRTIGAVKLADIAGTVYQSWITKAIFTVVLSGWTVIEGVLAGIPPMYIIVAATVVAAATAHLFVLVELRWRSLSVEHRLKSTGYPFAYNLAQEGEDVVITDGYAQVPLANSSDSPIHFRFKSLRVVIDGKTNEDMYGASERECYELPPQTPISFNTKTIDLGFRAPGYMGGIVECEIAYGKSPSRLRYVLHRKFKLHLHVTENGAVSSGGVEMDISTPMEDA